MPKVVGMDLATAQKTLSQANFTAVPTNVPSLQPAGTVVGQSPSAGSHAILGSAVALSVSTGHATKSAVPNVIGMSQADATAALQRAGFKVNVVDVPTSDRKQNGVVLDQDPKGGQQAQQGSTVSIAVGQYQKGHGHH